MSVNSYEELAYHVGHEIECVGYAVGKDGPENVAVECVTCGTVLVDYDRPEDNTP